ncbi:MAG: hypothetical protein KF788_08880 [Piscinibacter sp.]|nr:hypothetical protein [Piscinibacter sp.]
MAERRIKYVLQADDRASRAINGLRGNLGHLRDTGSSLNGVFGKLGVVLGGAFAGVTLTAFIKGQVDSLDRLNDLSDATGASVEKLSALEDIAKRNGTSFETAGDALLRFNKLLVQAKPGNEIDQALKAIGLDVERLRALDPADAFHEVARALAGFDDGPRKAQIVTALFQKNLEEIAPLLKDVGEQSELVGKVTAQQAEEAEKLNKQLAQLRTNSEDVARELAVRFIPAINGMFEAFRDKGGALEQFKRAISLDDLSLQRKALERLNLQIAASQSQLDEFEQAQAKEPANRAYSERVRDLTADLARMRAEAARASEALKSQATQLAPLLLGRRPPNEGGGRYQRPEAPPLPTPAKKAAKEEIDDASRALSGYVSQLEQQRQKTQDLTEVQQALVFLQGLGTTGQIPQVRELVLGLAQQNDELADEEKLRKQIADNAREQASALKSLDDELDALSGRAGDRRKLALTERLEELLAAGQQFSPAELERVVKGIAGIQDQVDELDEFSRQAGRNIQNALGDTVKSTLRGDFDDIGRLWENLLLDMVSQAIAAELGRALFGDFGKDGSLGGLVGRGLGAFLGFFDQGTDYVPRDGLAYIHQGEAILTREENARRGEGAWAAGPPVINQFDLSIGQLTAGDGVSRGEMAAVVSQALAAQELKFRRLLDSRGG